MHIGAVLFSPARCQPSLSATLRRRRASIPHSQERCSSLSAANTNLGKTVEALNELVGFFNVTKGVEPRLLAGPRGDYDTYFAMVDKLQARRPRALLRPASPPARRCPPPLEAQHVSQTPRSVASRRVADRRLLSIWRRRRRSGWRPRARRGHPLGSCSRGSCTRRTRRDGRQRLFRSLLRSHTPCSRQLPATDALELSRTEKP